MSRSVGLLFAAVYAAGVACAGPSTVESSLPDDTSPTGRSNVETSVRDAFIDCMAAEDITVENVDVEVGPGRHIESFSWDPAVDEDVEGIGKKCEDVALVQSQVSRT